jgi:hypothetical protein
MATRKRKDHVFQFKPENQRVRTALRFKCKHGRKPFKLVVTLAHMKTGEPGKACTCGIAIGGMAQLDNVETQLGYRPYSFEMNGSRLYVGCKANRYGISELESFVAPAMARFLVKIFDTPGKGYEAVSKLACWKENGEVVLEFVPTKGSTSVTHTGPGSHATCSKDPSKVVKHKGAIARLVMAGLIPGQDLKLTSV